jgi:biotin carboxyl carrier protein
MAAIFSGGCSKQKTAAGPSGPPAMPATLATAERQTVPQELQAIGNVEPFSNVQVKAQVAGELVKVQFAEGQNVNQGDLLFQIDPRPYADALNQAQAAVERDRALLAQAEANVSRDEAQLRNAETDAKRQEELVKAGIVARSVYDTSRTAADVYKESERADRAAIASARASLAADVAAQEKAKLDLSYCEIHAPISGRTGNLLVHAGNLVKVNDVPLVVIHQLAPIFVRLQRPGGAPAGHPASQRQSKLAVRVSSQDDPGRTRPAGVSLGDRQYRGRLHRHHSSEGHLRESRWTALAGPVRHRRSDAGYHPECEWSRRNRAGGQKGQFVYVVKPDNTVEIADGDHRPGIRQQDGDRKRSRRRRPGGDGRPIVPVSGGQGAGGGRRQDRIGAAVNLSQLFIQRPIMTVLVCFAIVLFGAVAFRALPVAALPSVDYPTIEVSASLPGASPETMASTVATPLEREFSTIAGIQQMSSTNSQGSTDITVQFSLDRSIDAAAQDVQAHIASAGGRLPPSMPRPPSYQKVNPAEQAVLYLTLNSDSLPLYTVTEYADTMLAQRISMVGGVSRVQVFGEQKYAVRVQVDPDKLAAHNIGIDEVQRAISSSNSNLPTGQLNGEKQAFTIESSGTLAKAADYRPIIVAWRNGTPVRLEQLGNVIDSVENNKLIAWMNDVRGCDPGHQPAAGHQHGGSGGQRPPAAAAVPAGASAFGAPAVMFDTSQSIRNSIRDVELTLLLTVCIVILVIFLFLRNISATLIPGAAVPFSIVGTFAVMYLLGYSLNYLSLMALTLSVGFVVDDAIVMLENIVRHMEMGETRMHAAVTAAREIGFTIVSMTISLVAVFIPVLFLGGVVGRLLHEFSVTIVVAILISGFVSLSLTPMLGSRFPEIGARDAARPALSRAGGRFRPAVALVRTDAQDRSALQPGSLRWRWPFLMLVGTVYLFFTCPPASFPARIAASCSA